MDQDRRKGGGKLSRSETVTVRLDPKLRYLAELAARKQRRTLSSYIEWAIEDSLQRVALDINDSNSSVANEAEALWDVDDADRFAKLALRHSDLMTHEEQVLWKLVRENGYLWRGSYQGSQKRWTWTTSEDNLVFERLRENWSKFTAVAESGTGHAELPSWPKTQASVGAEKQPLAPKKTGFDDMDDEIPF